MAPGISYLFILGLAANLVAGAYIAKTAPIVELDYGSFQGKTANDTDQWLGIPYASPPKDTERLKPPQPPSKLDGVQQATKFGPACPQMGGGAPPPPMNGSASGNASAPAGPPPLKTSEDCLTINVVRPAGAKADANLPVLVWIYGGAFSLGATAMYDGSGIVRRSVATGQPLIYVSLNYRVAGWGFMPGKQIREAGVGNLGLQDQRFALQWIQSYINSFGGDPTRVTLWGQSAGAISVSLQMLTNGGDTEDLFHAGFMNSGSPLPAGPLENRQDVFDIVAKTAGCEGKDDQVQCLREVSAETFEKAVNAAPNPFSFEAMHLSYQPRADGKFLPDDPQKLVASGSYAKIPIVNGDVDDEGTLFSIGLMNLTTDKEAIDYIHDKLVHNATDEEMKPIAELYPSDPAKGSPYDTGDANAITPEFKRLSAIHGDLIFQAPRRFFLNQTSTTQNTWSFLYKKDKKTPVVGSAHGSDLEQFYTGAGASSTGSAANNPASSGFVMMDYLINFVNTFDVNGKNPSGKLIEWPKYSTDNVTLLQFADTGPGLSLVPDTYRKEGMDALTQLMLKYPI